ncbi:uncharacterized protein Triagg1_3857 [Trichoderma aggressivum f. europaeum]|uniref:Uncharacterized protein n=1 Tax=Trichoderma aggressivum f. europaeum TaxID=173218 RepID=A0AAE1IGZ0_9HYPO|nr:hypothetical protein Triagg1_3857 [Trichoderma aggressivum f. europaeum]
MHGMGNNNCMKMHLLPTPPPPPSYDDFQWISNEYYRFGHKPHHHLPSARDQQSFTDQEKSPLHWPKSCRLLRAITIAAQDRRVAGHQGPREGGQRKRPSSWQGLPWHNTRPFGFSSFSACPAALPVFNGAPDGTPTCRGADTHPDGHADDGPPVQTGAHVGAQMNAWMGSTTWLASDRTTAAATPNPISSRHPIYIGASKSTNIHRHPPAHAGDAVAGRGIEISDSSQPAGWQRDPEAMQEDGSPALAAPQPLHPLPMYHPAAGPMRPHTASWWNGSWAAITAFPRAQPSYAGALLGRPRRRAGHIKSHFAGWRVLHPRR